MLITNHLARGTVVASTFLLALVFAISAASAGSLGDHLGAGLVATFFAAWSLRSLRLGVEVTAGSIVVRGFLVTKVIPWDLVRDVTVIDSGNVTGQGHCVALVLTSGEIVRATATGSFSEAKVNKMCKAIQSTRS